MMKTAANVLLALLFLAAYQGFARGGAGAEPRPQAGSPAATATLVYQHAIPGVPGKSIKGVLVEYAPGASSPPHTHPKSAIIYATVIEGTIRSRVNDGPEKTYGAGQNFTELPGDRHLVSANASDTKPAKLLAVFVVDDSATALTIPLSQ